MLVRKNPPAEAGGAKIQRFKGLSPRTKSLLQHDHPTATDSAPDVAVTKPTDVDLELVVEHVDASDRQLTFRHKEKESGVTALTQLISVGTAELHNLPLRQAKWLWITEWAEDLGKSAVSVHLMDAHSLGSCVFVSDICAPILEIGVKVTDEDIGSIGDGDTALGGGEGDGGKVSQVARHRFDRSRGQGSGATHGFDSDHSCLTQDGLNHLYAAQFGTERFPMIMTELVERIDRIKTIRRHSILLRAVCPQVSDYSPVKRLDRKSRSQKTI